MNDSVKDNAQKLVQSLHSTPATVVPEDPMVGLQNNIIKFFKDRISTVRKQEELKDLVQSKLTLKVSEDELTFDELKSLFVTLSRESNSTSEGIIGLFKPTPGTQSPFAQNLSKAPKSIDDDIDNFYQGLSAEERQKLDLLYRYMSSSDLEE